MLSAHVRSIFGDTICLLTNRKMIKIMTLIDLHIVLTCDCWHCFLVFNISVSHALEMTINFYYPTLELFCFSFTQPFTHSKFCLPNLFLFGVTPAIKWPLPKNVLQKNLKHILAPKQLFFITLDFTLYFFSFIGLKWIRWVTLK
jgi:hypothetical protein